MGSVRSSGPFRRHHHAFGNQAVERRRRRHADEPRNGLAPRRNRYFVASLDDLEPTAQPVAQLPDSYL